METGFDNGKTKVIRHKGRFRSNCWINCERRLLIYGRERGKKWNVVVMPKGKRDPHVVWNERLRLKRDGGRGCDGSVPN